MNARGRRFRNPAKFCIGGVCLTLFIASIGLLRAATPEAQTAPLVIELKLDREVEPVLATYIDEGLAEAARRQGRFAEFHMPLLEARHRDRLEIDRPEVVERVAVDSGLDLERFRKDLADPDLLTTLERDHLRARREHGVFGTPTFVFPDGSAAYVRLAEAPEASDAIRVLDRVISVAAFEPSILEIKRPRKSTPD